MHIWTQTGPSTDLCLGRVEGAMTAPLLGQYFRSFLIKLSMMESQLGQLGLGGTHA